MKMIIAATFTFLTLTLSIQTGIVQAGNPMNSGYLNKIRWQKSGFSDGRANSQIAYNIRNGRMSCTSPVVDTSQEICYDDGVVIPCPAVGEAFDGQDAQYSGRMPSYTDNGDGTVTDNVTGLMWQQSSDTSGDGEIKADDKLSYAAAVAGAETLALGGYNDWRLPTIKELYSLMDFRGIDPSGYDLEDTSSLIPFIHTGYFDFAYGDTERPVSALYIPSMPPAPFTQPTPETSAVIFSSV